jgi:hypothetical protein
VDLDWYFTRLMKPHDHSLYFIDKCMPKSIFEVLDDYYYKSGYRTGTRPYINRLFIKSKIKKGLEIHQKMIVFSFMMALDNATDTEFEESTLF